jgi:hypothetical protein
MTMGYMKELDIRIRNGGDDAVAAVQRIGEDWRLQLEAAAGEVERLRLTDAERASMTRAIETLEGVEYMEAFRTENDATAAATLRSLLDRTRDGGK